MDPLAALAIAAALVVGAVVLGLGWRAAQGRVRRVPADAAPLDGVELVADLTLVQFSSAYCAPCRATARVLGELVRDRPDAAHLELDVAAHPELAARFGVLQTPTTIVVDRGGRPLARIGGAVRRAELAAELDRLPGAPAIPA